MSTAVADMKQTDLGHILFKGPDAGFEFMSKNFKIFSGINDSWVDFFRRSAKETAGENAGQSIQWRKAMEIWQQWPAQALIRCFSSAETLKACMQYCIGRQKTYSDLGIAWLNCLQKISQACREARQNGNAPSDAWKGCLKASEEFTVEEMSFLADRIKAFCGISSFLWQQEAAAENSESAKVKEVKTSKT